MYMYNALIPACRLCVGSVLFVAIHPIPKHMQHSTSPFLVCKKGDHQTCHHMSRTTNPWFPHTVEELVIWTVEREKSEGNGHLRCMMCLCVFTSRFARGGVRSRLVLRLLYVFRVCLFVCASTFITCAILRNALLCNCSLLLY